MIRIVPSPLLVAVLLTGACGGKGAAAPLVRGRAERDLDCPSADIRVQEELGGRYKAVGCGRKAYYRTACEGITCDVRGADEPAIPWKDRPDPSDPTHPR
jgi:hypothetical protein